MQKHRDNKDMGKPFGKASTCLRVAASAKAGAHLYAKQHSRFFDELEFIKSEILYLHKKCQSTAFRSLEGRFAHGRFAAARFPMENSTKLRRVGQ